MIKENPQRIAYHREKYDDYGRKTGLDPFPAFSHIVEFNTPQEAMDSPEFVVKQDDYGRDCFPRLWNAKDLGRY